jgi:hypothetical protein
MKSFHFSAVLLLAILNGDAQALSLCKLATVEQAYERSSHVVAATAEGAFPVRANDGRGDLLSVMWYVNVSWKGTYKPGARFVTTSSAGTPILKGQPMLLYLKGRDPHSLDLQPACSRSGALQERLQDVRDLYRIAQGGKNVA